MRFYHRKRERMRNTNKRNKTEKSGRSSRSSVHAMSGLEIYIRTFHECCMRAARNFARPKEVNRQTEFL